MAGHPFWPGLRDAVFGVVIFFLLGAALITYIHLVRPPTGPLLDLTGLFAGLRAAPDAYGWLAFMLITTLVPTLLHFSIALMSLGFSCTLWWRRQVVYLLTKGGEGNAVSGIFGAFSVAAMAALAVWMVCGTLWLAVTMNHGQVLGGVISIFEWYAQLIEAVDAA